MEGSVSCSQQWWQVAWLCGTVLWHEDKMSINHVLWLQIFSQQKHNKIKPQHLLYVNSKYTRNASQIAKIAGPAYTILTKRIFWAKTWLWDSILQSSSITVPSMGVRSDTLSFLLKILHVHFLNYNLKTYAWWNFSISFPVWRIHRQGSNCPDDPATSCFPYLFKIS